MQIPTKQPNRREPLINAWELDIHQVHLGGKSSSTLHSCICTVPCISCSRRGAAFPQYNDTSLHIWAETCHSTSISPCNEEWVGMRDNRTSSDQEIYIHYYRMGFAYGGLKLVCWVDRRPMEMDLIAMIPWLKCMIQLSADIYELNTIEIMDN